MSAQEQLEIRSPEKLKAWLSTKHARANGIWLVTYKKHVPDWYVSRDEVLDAVIAYGWIDGRRKKLDDDRTMQFISPRRQQIWAQTYKDRAKRLVENGEMEEPGRRAIEYARKNGLWDALDHVDALIVPLDLRDALSQHKANAWFEGAAPSYRRNVLRWIASAKKPETREKRVSGVAAHAARGEKVKHF